MTDESVNVKHGNPFTAAFQGTLGKGCGCITLVILFFVFIGIMAASGSKKTVTTNVVVTETKTTVKSTPIVVNAKTLVGEFDKNKLVAQDKYTGKIVQITAVVNNISGGDFGDYYLSLEPGNEEYYFGTTIQAFFKDKTELTSLTKGQSVTVVGIMNDMSLGTVIMKDCNVVK